MINDELTEFAQKAAEKNEQQAVYEKPFIADPENLSLASREEMTYKYRFLETTITFLASEYRLNPKLLENYFEEYEIEPELLKTQEDFEKHSQYVIKLYKDIRVRMSGLVALQTAKIWESLAESESMLSTSLELASKEVLASSYIDPKVINVLINAHTKMVDRQQLIKKAIEVPAASDIQEIANVLSEQMKSIMKEVNGDHSLPKVS